MKFRPILLALPFLLSACGGNEAGAEGERKTAAGEVLGGSISDEMLPLDTVTSTSPPLGGASVEDDTEGDRDRAPARDSDQGPGEPPRDPAPVPAAPPSEDAAQ